MVFGIGGNAPWKSLKMPIVKVPTTEAKGQAPHVDDPCTQTCRPVDVVEALAGKTESGLKAPDHIKRGPLHLEGMDSLAPEEEKDEFPILHDTKLSPKWDMGISSRPHKGMDQFPPEEEKDEFPILHDTKLSPKWDM